MSFLFTFIENRQSCIWVRVKRFTFHEAITFPLFHTDRGLQFVLSPQHRSGLFHAWLALICPLLQPLAEGPV